MRRMLLTTTAALTMMLAPQAEAHSTLVRHRTIGADPGGNLGALSDRLLVTERSDAYPANVSTNQRTGTATLAQANDAADEGEDTEDDEDEDAEDEEDQDSQDDGDDPDDEDEDDGAPDEDDGPDENEGDVTADDDNEGLGGDVNDRTDDSEDEEDDEPSDVPGQLSVTINGRATLQAGLGGDLTRGLQFRNKTEVEFNVGGKADFGLLYGLKVQLEDTTGSDSISETTFDEAYVYLGGRWGRLEFGDTDDVVAGGLLVYAPSVGIGQIDGDYGKFSKLSLDDYYPFYPDLETSTKVNYYSPRIAGFQFGVSYTPYYADRGQSVVGFKPGVARGTSSSSLTSSSVSGSSVPGSLSTGAIPQAVVPSSSLRPVSASAPASLSARNAPEGSAVSSSSSSFKNVSAAIPAASPRPPVLATPAIASPVALTSQVIEDEDEDEDEDEEDEDEDEDDDEDDDEDEDGTDEEPDIEEPVPAPVPVPVQPTPEQPGPVQPTPEQPGPVPPPPEQPSPVPPTPEQPTPEQPSPEQPAPQPQPVNEPQPETPVVEIPDEDGDEDEEEEIGYRDITTLAVNYQRDLGNVTLTGSAAIMNGNGYGEGFKDFTAWLGGIQVGFADFTFGGGFGKFDGFNSVDWQWNIGATYDAGPFSVGAQYAWAKDVNGDKSWATGVGVNYVLAPGLSLQADYVHSKVDFDRSGSVNTADIVILGLQVSF